MENMAVRKLFTLLSACTSDESSLARIVLEGMEQSDDKKVLSAMGNFAFLTSEAWILETRMSQFKIPPVSHCSTLFDMSSNLRKMVVEFKQLREESEKNAKVPINQPYQSVHIMEKGRLSDLIMEKKRALEDSEGYQVWKDRNNYVYQNDAASQLKNDMDSFTNADSSLEEIHASYAILNNFKNHFERNERDIITVERVKQESKRKKFDNFSYSVIVFVIISAIGLIVTVFKQEGFWSGFGVIIIEILAFFAVYIISDIISKVLGIFVKRFEVIYGDNLLIFGYIGLLIFNIWATLAG
jgi:hypothetical protein